MCFSVLETLPALCRFELVQAPPKNAPKLGLEAAMHEGSSLP